MEEIFKIKESSIVPESIAHSWYKKSHNHYEPSEQVTRDYREPFNKCLTFGKIRKCQQTESRIKNILIWINHEPVTLVSRQQADFVKRIKADIGQTKKPEISYPCADITHKKSIKELTTSNSSHDSASEEQIQFWWQCLQDLNNFRRKIKKLVPEVPFLDIESDLSCLDKEYVETLPENEVFAILEKYHIFPNKEFLIPLLDILQLRKNGNINYRELLYLLNWKRPSPVLPKIKQAENLKHIAICAESIKNSEAFDDKRIRTAGLPTAKFDVQITTLPRAGISPDTENLGDQTSVQALISPSIFTKYGLTHIDFFKTRNKEEIQNIFENIGFEFSKENFDILWQKGLEIDCTDGVSVETFRQLLASSDQIISYNVKI